MNSCETLNALLAAACLVLVFFQICFCFRCSTARATGGTARGSARHGKEMEGDLKVLMGSSDSETDNEVAGVCDGVCDGSVADATDTDSGIL